MSTSTSTTSEAGEAGDQQQSSEQKTGFTQADVDRMISERVKREQAKYADYEDLKAKVAGAKSAEDRIADLEAKLTAAAARDTHRQMVDRVVREHKLTDPDDVDLVATAPDEDAAKRLAKRLAADNKRGNHVPGEGKTPTKAGEADEIETVRQLFGRT
jgi:aminopeptidase N